MIKRTAVLMCLLVSVSACESAYYSVQEQFGVLKNEILVDRVEEAMEAQQEAKTEFKDALEQFEAVLGVPDSELKMMYQQLSEAYEDAADTASLVRRRIDSVENVAEDLFDEWQEELSQISNTTLRRKSSSRLKSSRRSHDTLLQAMNRAEAGMAPVLTSFNDHVLYLKHNLNAQAIDSLQSDIGGIGADVDRLIVDMEKSIAEAQKFIISMEGVN